MKRTTEVMWTSKTLKVREKKGANCKHSKRCTEMSFQTLSGPLETKFCSEAELKYLLCPGSKQAVEKHTDSTLRCTSDTSHLPFPSQLRD